MLVILDNGHGINTLGKRGPKFPNGVQILEYDTNRKIVAKIEELLKASNIPYHILVPQIEDISLTKRINMVNEICKNEKNCLLLSIHCNASPNGSGKAKGWECWVGQNASNNSKRCASLFYERISYHVPMIVRRYSREVPYWTEFGNIAIVRRTNCPAVLTENGFMTNQSDSDFLASEEGLQAIANLHFDVIKRYFGLETE